MLRTNEDIDSLQDSIMTSDLDNRPLDDYKKHDSLGNKV